VSDVARAVEFYVERLGFTVGFTWGEPPTFAGVTLGEAQMFLEEGTPTPQGAGVYFDVGDPDALYDFHRANDVIVGRELADRPWGMRDYTVRDLNGYSLTFGCAKPETEPALPIERVDVPVRLEKRLAAALTDLAARKGMTVSSCLEETLLHTFEPLGDGVASPHTAGDLRYIQELKRKHGIDYDCHASYRFVERE
jgi:uncharacterized glyoxalase superfamily protein PhnB